MDGGGELVNLIEGVMRWEEELEWRDEGPFELLDEEEDDAGETGLTKCEPGPVS